MNEKKDPYPLEEVKKENQKDRDKEIAEKLLKEIPYTKPISFYDLADKVVVEKQIIKSFKQLRFFIEKLKHEGLVFEPEKNKIQRVQDWAIDAKEVKLHVGSNTFIVKIKVVKE